MSARSGLVRSSDDRLLIVGRDPSTSLGHALGRLERVAEEADARVLAEPPDGRLVVIGAAASGALDLARRAAASGWRALLEPLGALGPSGLAELTAAGPSADTSPGRLVPALRRRHEPDARWAHAGVGRGAVGLPWGATAEALASAAPDALTEALDLVDALERTAGVRLQAAVRIDRGPRARKRHDRGTGHTFLASLAFEHGVVGQVAARIGAGDPGRPEMATLRVTGSHGTLLAELDAPVLEIGGTPGKPGQSRLRLGPGGADQLLAAFLGMADGGTQASLATLEDAARLLVLLDDRSDRRGEP